MLRILPVLLALPLVVGFGLVDGFWNGRWHRTEAAEQAAARLDAVPMSVGAWEAEALPMEARELAKTEANGYLMRRYVNRDTHKAVTVLIVAGRPGPISLHPPDVCYQGAGYGETARSVRRPMPEPAPGKPAEFWVGRFQKTGPTPDPLQIYWSWSDGHGWAVPNRPRVAFARSTALYKLYVIQSLSRPDEPDQGGPGDAFLRAFLPQLEQYLFPSE